MKTRFFIVTLLVASFIFFLVSAYAHDVKSGIKTEVKKIDKGIQVTITSDNPDVAKEIQENSRYYEDMLAYDDHCPHMEHMAYYRGCMMSR